MIARRAHTGEAGFAMLVVFLLAGLIAIGLYLELPRVVMESQRDKEELLIDRGTQYKRAIQVFYRKFSRYPTDLDALDNTNNIRFLRRRYKDPMTGEDEWRLIHAAGPGIFTDSLVNAPPGAQPAQTADASGGSSEETATPLWRQQRPSDMILAGGDTSGSMQPPMPGMEETPPQQPASNSGMPAPGTVVTASVPGQTGAALTLPDPVPTGPPPPGTIITPQGGNQPPMPIVPGMIAVAPGQMGGAYPTTVTAAGGSQTTQTSNPAMQMINQLLSSPNPRGMATAVQTTSAQQPLQAGGIGGVASRLESESIKVYNDRSKYNEWEFIYDPRQDRTARQASPMNQQNRAPNQPSTNVPLTGTPGTNTPGGPQNPNNPFGGGPPPPPPGRGQGR